jgi:hypothetical protein
MYTSPIFLPFDQLLITLSILATNGTDSSPVVVEQYMTDIVNSNARLPHSSTNARPGAIIPDNYPYGTPPFEPKQQFLNPADSGVTVYNPAKPAQPTAFDGAGNPTAYTNKPYDSSHYQITYSFRDAEGASNVGLIGNGQIGGPLGNVPGAVTLPPGTIGDIAPNTAQTGQQGPEETSQFTTMFDPRAMVIFQDFSKEDPTDPPQINRQYFSLEDPERVRDGTLYFNTGQDASAPVSGSFVRAHYNPRTNEITHYYRDSWSNRWIISTSPYQPNANYSGNSDLAASAMGRSSKVFEWIPFQRRVLF